MRARLSEIALVTMGQSPPGYTYNRRAEGLPLLNGPAEFGPSTPRPSVFTTSPTKVSEVDDLLFCVRGATTGRMNWSDQTYCLGRGVASVRGIDRSDTRFIYYALRADLESLLTQTNGSVFANLSGEQFRRFEIPWPERAVRTRIAGILGALDDKIELNRRTNETLDALAQAWFGSTPRTAIVPLGELATFSRDAVDPSADPEELFAHFSIPAFDNGQVPVMTLGSSIKSSKLSVPDGCVLLSKLNPRIPRVWLPDLRGVRHPVCSTEFLVALPTARSSRELLYCLFGSKAFADDFASRVAGTSGSHQRVRAADARAVEVAVPRAEDIVELTATLKPILGLIAANRRESRTLAELRDTLLPKLISGELQISGAVCERL